MSDDVRRAAVLNLGFVLMNVPEQCPKIVSLLAESYNPHVRWAPQPAVIALRQAVLLMCCAASGEAILLDLDHRFELDMIQLISGASQQTARHSNCTGGSVNPPLLKPPTPCSMHTHTQPSPHPPTRPTSSHPPRRYGAAMAVGIACAGTGMREAMGLLEPMLQDATDFVQQVGGCDEDGRAVAWVCGACRRQTLCSMRVPACNCAVGWWVGTKWWLLALRGWSCSFGGGQKKQYVCLANSLPTQFDLHAIPPLRTIPL